ncbi:MAG: RdgB/HAM1 family non-canonical purine NTP pyrophosphatase [Salinivirgaceae bacterium]
MINKLIFATNNPNKLEEVQKMLGSRYQIVSMAEAGIDEDIPENEATLEGNALAKADYIYQKLKLPVIADDTGLEVDYLNGAPGVHSARFAGADKDPEANMRKLLSALTLIKNRKAQFRTVICLRANEQTHYFEGVVHGSILQEKQGAAGFGYDPIFKPDGFQLSFAQMPMQVKNRISHRGRAIHKLTAFLLRNKF